VTPEAPFVERAAGRAALDIMGRLLALCPPEALDWSSIALHDAMVAREDLVFCPAVYFYATYAEADMPRRLSFFDLPGVEGNEPKGSTIGGTGIGLSSECREPAAARAYIAFLMRPETQKAFAGHHGQPARREAWEDPEIDRRFAGAFAATRRTMESAWIRPRYPGYLGFQARGGELVESHLRGAMTADRLLDSLARLHEAAGRETD
jgi:multiple sugar transport system substrate-binding protein